MPKIKENTCLHCGSDEAKYCEDCYQRLLAENMTLKFTLKGFLEEQKGIAIGIDFGRGDSKQVENHIPYID